MEHELEILIENVKKQMKIVCEDVKQNTKLLEEFYEEQKKQSVKLKEIIALLTRFELRKKL